MSDSTWTDCDNIQCAQLHEYLDSLLVALEVECPKDVYAAGKAIGISEAINRLKEIPINRINILTAEVANLKKHLAENIKELMLEHARYIELSEAVLGRDMLFTDIPHIIQTAKEQRELAEMFREAKK